jgi:hypothetical protein
VVISLQGLCISERKGADIQDKLSSFTTTDNDKNTLDQKINVKIIY